MKLNLLVDHFATFFIKTGGILVISTVIGIIVLITSVALPLFSPATSALLLQTQLPTGKTVAAQIDEYLQDLYLINNEGVVTFGTSKQGEFKTTHQHPLRANSDATVLRAESHAGFKHSLLWSDGQATLVQVNLPEKNAEIIHQQSVPAGTTRVLMRIYKQNVIVVSLNAIDSTFFIKSSAYKQVKEDDELDFFADDEEVKLHLDYRQHVPDISSLDVSADGMQVVVGTTQGQALLFTPTLPIHKRQAQVSKAGVSAIKFTFGDRSFIVADAQGKMHAWQANKNNALEHIKTLPAMAGKVLAISKAQRSKLFASFNDKGQLQASFMTSSRKLLLTETLGKIEQTSIAPRDDALVVLMPTSLKIWQLHAPHPEVSLTTMLRRVWYENYPRADYIWQSSSASDDFEPKLSLIPLIFGTLKGTLYAMLFVLPLSILAAVYVNQFATARFKAIIKPTIEILASLPSVVIGFLAALWFAPFLQNHLTAFFLSLVTVPFAFLLCVYFWSLLPQVAVVRRIEQGLQFVLLFPVIVCGCLVAYQLAAPVENFFFQGDFLTWLYETVGMRYDQRNSIVIAFALGFAVMPIVFSITEDSIDTVPASLSAASLALGASRWQTIWRVLLPSAFSGILGAAIIGLGRAVGETMIVLMATGNTPIIDLSPFNGMRTLAANIAVEVPEAPVDGTLYRTLFLCAVVLFCLTFFFNTLAELVRTKLRTRFGNS